MALFQIAEGVYIPNQWKLSEGFQFVTDEDEYVEIKANISLDHLDAFFRAAVEALAEPVFLVLETPCNEVKEIELRKDENSRFHLDIYYSKLCTQTELLQLYSKYSDLLLNDGFIRFGVAARDSKHEVFVAAYKIVHLMGPKPNSLSGVLSQFEIPEVDRLVTAWDLFSRDDPGTKSRYTGETGDIYEMIESLMRSEKIFFKQTVEE
jgi:hypothetical protein